MNIVMTSIILHVFYYVKLRPPNLYEAHQKSRKYKQDKNILTMLNI